ncbi:MULTISPECIES: hypothetical protein [unclassified Caballeronia]|uniref:hypothetical protein n=1 Tax=unclassified Caballeronia TaxID=2646786 RepID=UPI001FCFE4FE|nr:MULTISPECIES: hypothetical protein [unclassified Caballeronia]
MRERAPVFSGKTSRPAVEYAGCVQQGWIDAGYLGVNFVPTPGGVTLSTTGVSGTYLLLDVVADSDTRRVTFYSRAVFGEQKYIDVARKCL